MFMQQIQGVIRLSSPLIILYNMNPVLFASTPGQFFCALIIGFYLCCSGWKQVKNFPNSLKYSPTDRRKELLSNSIQECDMDPDKVILKYAYTNEFIALANGSTVVIDPVLWHGFDDDQEAEKVKDVFEKQIQPHLSCAQEKRISAIRNALNPAAQRFIFKHELGHLFYNFSYKYLVVIFIIGTLATYSGVMAAATILSVNGFSATLLGMFVGGASDLLLTYTSNIVWKLREEKKADQFAAQHSSHEDIEAAILFFEQHQEIIDTNKEQGNFLAYLPSAIKTGHPDGKSRAEYLRQLILKK